MVSFCDYVKDHMTRNITGIIGIYYFSHEKSFVCPLSVSNCHDGELWSQLKHSTYLSVFPTFSSRGTTCGPRHRGAGREGGGRPFPVSCVAVHLRVGPFSPRRSPAVLSAPMSECPDSWNAAGCRWGRLFTALPRGYRAGGAAAAIFVVCGRGAGGPAQPAPIYCCVLLRSCAINHQR